MKCGKGCSNCCYFSVTILDDEALALVHYSSSKGIQIPFKRVRMKANYEQSFDLPRENALLLRAK